MPPPCACLLSWSLDCMENMKLILQRNENSWMLHTTFCAYNLHRIGVSIEAMDLEHEPSGCNWDFLQISDGSNEYKCCGTMDDVDDSKKYIETTGFLCSKKNCMSMLWCDCLNELLSFQGIPSKWCFPLTIQNNFLVSWFDTSSWSRVRAMSSTVTTTKAMLSPRTTKVRTHATEHSCRFS